MTERRLVGYCRVSTAEQGSSGLGLDAQENAIRDAVSRRGDVLVAVIREVASGGKDDREGFETAIGMCGTEADGIIVAKLDRATRSLAHFARIMEASKRDGWAFVALDLNVDTSTPAGELVANVMASVAQWERSVISERTRAALAVAKADGRLRKPQRACSPEAVARLLQLRDEGLPLGETARRLADEGVPTAQGGKWTARTVKLIEDKHRAQTG